MSLQASMRHWLDELSWQLRGVFATEANRRVGFWVRALCQPAEIQARKELALQLERELDPELRVPDGAGHLRLPSARLPDLTDVCSVGRAIANASRRPGNGEPGGKAFHRNQLAEDDQLQPLLRVALDRRMIALVSAYLGTVPVLADVDYLLSLPSGKPWKKSQLWHCDDDAPRQLKLFVYCEDVGADDGPFELIAADDSQRVRGEIGYRYAGRRYRVDDELMDRHLPHDRQLAIEGKAGSAFVVDTARCFHKGSRIVMPDRRRMVGVVLYCTPNGAKLPLRLASRPGPFAHLAASYPGELERAVLGQPIARASI